MPSASVLEIPGDFAPLVRKARRKPVALSQNGGKTVAAYLVSPKTYREMAELVEKMEEAEDAYWLRQVAKVRAEEKKNPPKESIAERDKKCRKLLDDILAS